MLVAVSTACSSSPAAAPTNPTVDGGINLRGICPDTIVVQSSWYPDITHSYYQVLGDRYRVDPEHQSVTGPLVAPSDSGFLDTGVKIEIRAGGPAVGFVPIDELMWRDRSITLGQQGTDEQLIAASRGRPILAVFAPLDLEPLVLMWDSAQHPEFNTVQDVGTADVPVLTIKDDPSTLYLIATGILRENQLADGYDGSPRPWLRTGRKAVIAGYATKDPYTLGLIAKKKIGSALVADAGYPNYPRTTVTIRRNDRPALDSCLKRLVPIMQRAHAAFMSNPERVIETVVALNASYKAVYAYTPAIARYGHKVLKDDALVFTGRDGRVGDFDTSPRGRVEKLINTLRPAYATRGIDLPPLTPEDLATNDYLAPVGLPAGGD